MKILAIIYVAILVIGLFGCEKDAVIESDEGMILGRWEGCDRTIINKGGSRESLPALINCEGNILDFFEDGRVRWVDFIKEEVAHNCSEDEKTAPIGRWERLSNGKYHFILTNAVTGAESIIAPALVTFEDNGTIVMNIRYVESSPEAGQNATYHYLTLFKR